MFSRISTKIVLVSVVILLQTSVAHLEAQETQFTVQELEMRQGDAITLSGFPENASITGMDLVSHFESCSTLRCSTISCSVRARLSHSNITYSFSGEGDQCRGFNIFGDCWNCSQQSIRQSTNAFNGLPVNGDYHFSQYYNRRFDNLDVEVIIYYETSDGFDTISVTSIINSYLLDD